MSEDNKLINSEVQYREQLEGDSGEVRDILKNKKQNSSGLASKAIAKKLENLKFEEKLEKDTHELYEKHMETSRAFDGHAHNGQEW